MSKGRKQPAHPSKIISLEAMMKQELESLYSSTTQGFSSQRNKFTSLRSQPIKQKSQQAALTPHTEVAPRKLIFPNAEADPNQENIQSKVNMQNMKRNENDDNLRKNNFISKNSSNCIKLQSIGTEAFNSTSSTFNPNSLSTLQSNQLRNSSCNSTPWRGHQTPNDYCKILAKNPMESRQKNSMDGLSFSYENVFTTTKEQLQLDHIEKISEVGKNIVEKRNKYFGSFLSPIASNDFEPQLPLFHESIKKEKVADKKITNLKIGDIIKQSRQLRSSSTNYPSSARYSNQQEKLSFLEGAPKPSINLTRRVLTSRGGQTSNDCQQLPYSSQHSSLNWKKTLGISRELPKSDVTPIRTGRRNFNQSLDLLNDKIIEDLREIDISQKESRTDSRKNNNIPFFDKDRQSQANLSEEEIPKMKMENKRYCLKQQKEYLENGQGDEVEWSDGGEDEEEESQNQSRRSQRYPNSLLRNWLNFQRSSRQTESQNNNDINFEDQTKQLIKVKSKNQSKKKKKKRMKKKNLCKKNRSKVCEIIKNIKTKLKIFKTIKQEKQIQQKTLNINNQQQQEHKQQNLIKMKVVKKKFLRAYEAKEQITGN